MSPRGAPWASHGHLGPLVASGGGPTVDGISLAPVDQGHCQGTSRTALDIEAGAQSSLPEVVQDYHELDPYQKQYILTILKRVREV